MRGRKDTKDVIWGRMPCIRAQYPYNDRQRTPPGGNNQQGADAVMTILAILQLLAILSVLFLEHKKPGEAVLWVSVIALLPLLGLLLYLVFGSTIRIKVAYWIKSRRLSEQYTTLLDAQMDALYDPDHDYMKSHSRTARQVVAFHLQCSNSMITRCNEVEIITTGEEKYDRLFEDIRAAKRSIHIAYYAIHNDAVGKQLAALLTQKAQEGIKVRVLYDSLGSMLTPPSLFRPLRKAGGEALRIKPTITHFRNHRKIVVIDGRIGYTGGMNIGNKYLGKNPKKSPWRDTHLRVRGESVRLLQYYFLYDWFYANKAGKAGVEGDDFYALFPVVQVTSALPCQVVTGGVDMASPTIKLSFLRLISAAKERIWIQTPYFIPSETILEALQVALASGVEVNLMIPAQSSSFFLEPTTNYYVDRLLASGLKVYQYEGYIHAKVMVVDDWLTCIGSANMDIRSLEIDDELQMLFYDETFTQRYLQVIDDDLRHSHQMDYDAFVARGAFARAKERFFHLFSPLM